MNLAEKIHMYHRLYRYRYRDEKESVRFVLGQQMTGKVALDIGANKGIYSYFLSKKVGPSGKVYSFDAQPELKDHLQDLSKSFGLNNINAEALGLSDQPGKLEMIRSKIGSGGARIIGDQVDVGAENEHIEIEVKTLDNYVKENIDGEIAFMKIDVEGHEKKVLNGAIETLRKHRPTVLMECTHDEAEEGYIFNKFLELGYKGFFFLENAKYELNQYDQIPYPRSDRHRNYMFEAH